jgi:hypothetical protein
VDAGLGKQAADHVDGGVQLGGEAAVDVQAAVS